MTDQTQAVLLAEVVETYQRLRRLETALAVHGVTVFQLALLVSVANDPGARLGRIARTLGISPTVMSIGIDRLEKRSLVARASWRSATGAGDRRSVAVDLTERGRELLASLAVIEVAQ